MNRHRTLPTLFAVLAAMALIVATASVVLAVARTAALPRGVSQAPGAIRSGGRIRTYQLLRPTTLPRAGAVPLVVLLHGGLGDGSGAIKQGNWAAAVARTGVIVVAPDGIGRTWNAGPTCCGAAARGNVDDVSFIVGLVQALEGRLPIDPKRVFATGISNGGMMSYRLACEASTTFAAIAPVSGDLLVPCHPTQPVSLLHIHGLKDENVPFAGGVGPKSLAAVDWPPVIDGLITWAGLDGCGASASTTTGVVTTRTWTGCTAPTSVRLITIANGGHSWPGGQRMALFLDPPSTAIDATSTIVAFFAAHGR
jgi:polyhydroxybutyrate depolymerase